MEIQIYTWRSCPYCERAKGLLRHKGVQFVEFSIDGDEQARAQMAVKSGGRTSVPQIFINGVHVGGCDDLFALDSSGKLDPMLRAG